MSNFSAQLNMFSIILKHSKSDKDSVGVPIHIIRTDTVFCPFSSMMSYLRWRVNPEGDEPLFVTEAGKVMTRAWFADKLRVVCQRCGLDAPSYTPHIHSALGRQLQQLSGSSGNHQSHGQWSSAASNATFVWTQTTFWALRKQWVICDSISNWYLYCSIS